MGTDRRFSRRAAAMLAAPTLVVAGWLVAGPATAEDEPADPVQGVVESLPGAPAPEEPATTTTTTAAPAPGPPTAPARRIAPRRSKTSGSSASTTTTPVTTHDSADRENILLDRYGELLDGQQVFAAPRRQPYPPSAFIPATGGLSGQRGDHRSAIPILVAAGACFAALAGAIRRLQQLRASLPQP